MKYSRLLLIATLVSSLGLPAAVRAQFNNGGASGSNYGIFGGGTSTSRASSGSGFGSSSGRSAGSGQSSFGQSSLGGFSQGAGGASLGASSGPSSLGSSRTVSPYLNLRGSGSNAAVNYFGVVRPQIQQDAMNSQISRSMQQNSNSLQQSNLKLGEQQEQMRQMFELNSANADISIGSQNIERAAQPGPRRRAADDANDYRSWAQRNKNQSPPE